ncbi:Putative major facilitator superfamily, MFS transporter superfamily [Septoria linicola]|uniref:Major facilitator superfamily, MFS transporter superfamily n=1 Tax=Septoria linicola TaxID=215465 RepID=A0A9Q9AVY4_9PEZI|nr:putative major facilitator superfamily, MFS transporter superfamily [Septoria linicola]USW52947.1 Putative major facilitator superfamily, MFS transporter superfamily [Septoria linicola]
MFLLKNLDADNISNARIMNKGTDQNIMTQLGMSSDAYTLLTVLYYIPYIVLEAPSNLLLKRAKPSVWQSRIMMTWGIVLCCHVACTNKAGIYAARAILGAAEAGMFPGVILQMTYWYRPDEMSVRLLYFWKMIMAYILGNLSGVFGGLFAYGFDLASSSAGLSGWQLLLLFEGLLTVVFAVVIYFCLPDFPNTARWLSDREKAFVLARWPPNAPMADELHFRWSEIKEALKDIRLWMFTLIWATQTVGTHGTRFYQSTVIANLGFTRARRLGSLPRPLYPLTFLSVILACYGVLYRYPSNGSVYAATMIANACASAWYPMMATGSALSIGFVNSHGQIGGAIGPQIFRSKYAPQYTQAFGVVMGIVGVCILLTLATWWVTRRTEHETRRLKLARVAAEKKCLAILDDVVDCDLRKRHGEGLDGGDVA